MADKSPDTLDPSVVMGAAHKRAADTVGLGQFQHVVLPFITENIDDADTFNASDSQNFNDVTIVRAAWEPTDSVQVNLSLSSNTITFATSASDANGYLHLWITK